MPSGGRSCYRWPSVGRLQFIKPIMRHTYRRPWRLPHINLRQSRHRRFWTASEKSRNPETGAYPVCSACSCKSLQPQISRKLRKFPRHFKGHFSIGNVQVRILPGQPRILVFGEYSFLSKKGPPNAGFSHRKKSPETDDRTFWHKNSRKSPAESQKTPIFWRLALETEE